MNLARTDFGPPSGWLARLAALATVLFCNPATADLSDTIQRVKHSVVAVGTFQRTRSPAFKFAGTGFAVGDGTLVATNAHVLPEALDKEGFEELKVAVSIAGREPEIRDATRLAIDRDRDLAVLRIAGSPLTPLSLRESGNVREGQQLAFTGFPIGSALGIYPVTHRAMVSSITPIAIPGSSANRLDSRLIKRLTAGTFPVLQLDATSYPGNSGSPLYEFDSGVVVGVLNMAFIKGTKESALSEPSGISYAIPVQHLRDLLRTVR